MAGVLFVSLFYVVMVLFWAVAAQNRARDLMLVNGGKVGVAYCSARTRPPVSRLKSSFDVPSCPQTHALALSYYARYGCSLAAPLLFYISTFLQLTSDSGSDDDSGGDGTTGRRRLGGNGPETTFYQVYGQRVMVSFIANNFAIFFPILVLVLVLFQVEF